MKPTLEFRRRALGTSLLLALASCGSSTTSPAARTPSVPTSHLQGVSVTSDSLLLTLADGTQLGLGFDTLCATSGVSCFQPYLPAPGSMMLDCPMQGGLDAVACTFSTGLEIEAMADGEFLVHFTGATGEITVDGRFDRSTAIATYAISSSGSCLCMDNVTVEFALR